MGYIKKKEQKYSLELAIEVAEMVVSGQMTYRAAQKEYKIKSNGTVSKWVKYYREGRLILPPTSNDTSNMRDANALSIKLKIAEEKLSRANLEIDTLKTVISLAEREFEIDIRKKSFSQQSKK